MLFINYIRGITMAEQAQTPQDTPSLDEQINKVLASADDTGRLTFDEGIDPLFKRACVNEQKARVNQANFTKGRQEIASLKATNQVLTDTIGASTQLTAEQIEELDDLKFTDPDSYFAKRNQYEREGLVNSAGKLKELTDAAASKALADLTLSERKDALADFQSHTGIVLTDDVMSRDIPPRLQDEINSMPFEAYLEKVAAYLGKTKVIKPTDDSLEQPNLEKLAGGSGGNTNTYAPDMGDGIL